MRLCNFCSGLRLWIPVLGEPNEGNGELRPYSTRFTVFDEFLDRTGTRDYGKVPRRAILSGSSLALIGNASAVKAEPEK